MDIKKKRTLLVFGVLLIGSAIVWGIWRAPVGTETSQGEITATGTAPEASSGTVLSDIPGAEYGFVERKITAEEKKLLPSAPALDRPVDTPESFSEEVARQAREELQGAILAVKGEPYNSMLWANLGLYRKEIDDFQGAKEAWEYSFALNPRNPVVADNLGVLYGFYLKDFTKAERNFRLAIELEPTAHYRYLRLYEFYSDILKDNVKAKAAIAEGVRATGDLGLQEFLETI